MKYMQDKNMSKKIVLKLILLVLMLIIILAAMPLSFWVCQQSQKSISLYVSPDFKLCNYDSFYDDTKTGFGFLSLDADSLFRENGLKEILHKDEILKSTLYVVISCTDGFVFPPHIGHFNPQMYITKTFSFEIYDSKTTKLLLKLNTWRGVFSDGYTFPEVMEKFKEVLIQAGWKEKKTDSTAEKKISNP